MSNLVTNVYNNLKRHQFLFEELVKRDFKQKYQRSILGVGWSLLSPLLASLVLYTVFSYAFGRRIEHFGVYLLCGNILFNFYRESTSGGMNSLMNNASIFTKVNVPKYMFLLSKNISAVINFGIAILVLLLFALFNGIDFSLNFILLLYPIICFILFNIGIGMILSAWFVFFRDIGYLYDVFCMLVMYGSAIFYQITIVPEKYRFIFYCNPVYVYISYFREIIIGGQIPDLFVHVLALGYAIIAIVIGGWIYKRYNHKFLYYV